jgi:hypothetical protein
MSRAIHGWDEQDALTPWRRYLKWRAGERATIKRRARQRERSDARREMRNDPEVPSRAVFAGCWCGAGYGQCEPEGIGS